LDGGTPNLDWRWNYRLGVTINEWGEQNLVNGPWSVNQNFSTSFAVGYQLISIGKNVVEINGAAVFHFYIDGGAERMHNWSAMMAMTGGWLPYSFAPSDTHGRIDKLVPYLKTTEGDIIRTVININAYRKQQAEVFTAPLELTSLISSAHGAVTANPQGIVDVVDFLADVFGVISGSSDVSKTLREQDVELTTLRTNIMQMQDR